MALITTKETADETTVTPSAGRTVTPSAGRAQVDERAARRRFEERTAVAPATTAPTGPRSRASALATISLMLGLAGLLAVFTGVLAGPGVGIGLLGALVGIGGISATSRRHVAGKPDALLGITFGLAAVVIGVLAITGNLPWLASSTDHVMRVRDWLDAQVPWLFPNS